MELWCSQGRGTNISGSSTKASGTSTKLKLLELTSNHDFCDTQLQEFERLSGTKEGQDPLKQFETNLKASFFFNLRNVLQDFTK